MYISVWIILNYIIICILLYIHVWIITYNTASARLCCTQIPYLMHWSLFAPMHLHVHRRSLLQTMSIFLKWIVYWRTMCARITNWTLTPWTILRDINPGCLLVFKGVSLVYRQPTADQMNIIILWNKELVRCMYGGRAWKMHDFLVHSHQRIWIAMWIRLPFVLEGGGTGSSQGSLWGIGSYPKSCSSHACIVRTARTNVILYHGYTWCTITHGTHCQLLTLKQPCNIIVCICYSCWHNIIICMCVLVHAHACVCVHVGMHVHVCVYVWECKESIGGIKLNV